MSRRAVVLAALGLAVLVAACSAPAWVLAATSSPSVDRIPLAVRGGTLAPGVGAGALVVAAAALALALARRGGQVVALLGMAAGGVLVAASAVAGAGSAEAAARTAALDAVGVPTLTHGPDVAVWPWVVAGLGVTAVLLAGTGAARTRRWAAASRRFDAAQDAAVLAVPAAGAVPAPTSRPDEPVATDERDADVWDALSRGEDPT